MRTDPAREVVDICRKLTGATDKPGDKHIANVFGVEQWSRDFYEIIFTIIDRLDFLSNLLSDLDLDDDQRAEIESHIESVKSVFSRGSIVQQWNRAGGGSHLLSGAHVAAISVLSGQVRAKVSYPKLAQSEIDEILELVDLLLSWLEDVQLSDQDFIRQALIDGLRSFRGRFSRVHWLGWNYTIGSLRDVVAAYMALERGFPDAQANTTAAAMLKKTMVLLESIWRKTGTAAEARDRASLIMEIYGWCAVVRDLGISGLLSPPN